MLTSHGNRCVATETVCQAADGKLTGDVFERSVNDNLRSSETAWNWWLDAGSREDISAEIKKITVPVLIAAGENDEAMTPELLEKEIARRVDNARLIVVPAVKHLLPLEVPEKITDLIREHCQKFDINNLEKAQLQSGNQPEKSERLQVK